MKKIKVVWLCGFSNDLIQAKIKPWRKGSEISPWINNLLNLFENNKEIELHVISLHLYVIGYKRFKMSGITYHFFNQGMPIIGHNWPGFFPFDLWTDYWITKYRVKRVINKLKPDIIHLHGAENTYHTPAIIQFLKKYPVFITLQGFIHKVSPDSKSARIKRRIVREKFIFRNFNHFGYRTETMKEVVKEFNPKANFHYHNYVQEINNRNVKEDQKEFDIVFFARIDRAKGIEDLLDATSILDRKMNNIQLLIVGSGSKEYKEKLKNKCIDLGIDQNVTWAGFLPAQKDVHDLVSKAKVSVLPTHYDMIPGTIIESMFLKIPIVSYNTGSIPEVNNSDEVISLVEKGDLIGLANEIEKLLKDDELRRVRAEAAHKRAIEMFDNREKIKFDIISAYKKVIIESYNETKK